MLASDTATGRVLVVEDDAEIADVLRRTLRQEGHEVRSPATAWRRSKWPSDFVPDLVILDLGLPRLDGVEVCRRLRAESDVADPDPHRPHRDGRPGRGPRHGRRRLPGQAVRAPGAAGADARTAAAAAAARHRLARGRRPSLNPDTREVYRGERPIELTNREFELLEYLMRNERLVVSRERLLEEVWGYDPMAMTNTIDVFISNLRRKLEAGGEPRVLHTKRGAGYVIKAARDEPA